MKKTFLAWLEIAVLAGVVTGAHKREGQKMLPRAAVHVDVFDPFGGAVRNATVHLYTPDRKRDVASPAGGSTLTDVPYGQYLLVVSDSGGGIAEREVTVNADEIWVRIGLAFPAGDQAWPGGGLTISGDIKPTPANLKEWWVRVEGVFLHEMRESPIQRPARFSISGLGMGAYLIEVFEGSKLRHVETIEIDTKEPNTHLTISLADERANR